LLRRSLLASSARRSLSVYPTFYEKGYPADDLSWTGQRAVWDSKKMGWDKDEDTPLPKEKMRLRPLVGSKGTTLTWGAEVVADLNDEVCYRELADLVHRYQILVFKRQAISPKRHVELARSLTPFLGAKLPLTLATDMGFHGDDLPLPEIAVLGKGSQEGLGRAVNNSVKGVQWPEVGKACSWHCDGAAFETVGTVTFIHMPVAAKQGGMTLYANGYDLYDALPTDLKIKAMRTFVKYVEDGNWQYEYDMKHTGMRRLNFDGEKETRYDHEHPLAPQHPVTRRRTLWTAPANVAFEDDQDLVEECLEAGLKEYYVHHYDDGDVVISDDRCMLHSTTPVGPDAGTRLLHRCGTELRSEKNRKAAFQYIYHSKKDGDEHT